MLAINYEGYASEHELLHLDSSADEVVQQQDQKQGEDERELIPVFVWKMGTREQQFPGVGELSEPAKQSASVVGNNAATCILQTSYFSGILCY